LIILVALFEGIFFVYAVVDWRFPEAVLR